MEMTWIFKLKYIHTFTGAPRTRCIKGCPQSKGKRVEKVGCNLWGRFSLPWNRLTESLLLPWKSWVFSLTRGPLQKPCVPLLCHYPVVDVFSRITASTWCVLKWLNNRKRVSADVSYLQQPREGPTGVAFPFGSPEGAAEEQTAETASSGKTCRIGASSCHRQVPKWHLLRTSGLQVLCMSCKHIVSIGRKSGKIFQWLSLHHKNWTFCLRELCIQSEVGKGF